MEIIAKFKDFSIRKKMSLILLSTLLLFALLVLGVMLPFFKWNLTKHLAVQQEALLTVLQSEIDNKISLATTQLEAVARIMPLALLDNPEMAQLFLEDRVGIGSIFDNGLTLMSATGELIAETPRQPQRTESHFASLPFFRQVIGTKTTTISRPFLSTKLGHHPVVQFCVPLFDTQGKLVAVFSAGLRLDGEQVVGGIAQHRIGENGYIYLFNKDRTIMVHPDKSRILQQDVPVGSNKLFDRALSGWEGTGLTVNSRGRETISSFKHLNKVPWILGLNNPADDAFAPALRATIALIAILTTLSASCLTVLWLALRSVTEPLAKFTDHLRKFDSLSHTQQRFEVARTASTEVQLLASCFNSMLALQDKQRESILSKTQELEARALALTKEVDIRQQAENDLRKVFGKYVDNVNLLRNISDNVPDLIWAKDLDNRYLFTNKANNDNLLFTLTPDEAIGKHHEFFSSRFIAANPELPYPYQFGDMCNQSDQKVLSTQKPMQFQESGYIAGKLICLDVYKAPLYDIDGVLIGTVGSARIVTREKQLEQETARLSRLYKVLSAINQQIVHKPQPAELFQFVCDTLLTSGTCVMAWIGTPKSSGGYSPVVAAGFPLEIVSQRAECICETENSTNVISGIDARNYRSILCASDQRLYQHLSFNSVGRYFIHTENAEPALLMLYTTDEILLTHGDERQLINELVSDLAFALDLAHQEQHQDNILKQLELADTAFSNSTEAIVVTDTEKRILSVNNAFCTITGYSAEEVIGQTPRMLKSKRHELDFYNNMWQSICETDKWRGEIWTRRKNGEVYPGHLSVSRVLDKRGEVSHFIGVFSDQSAKKKSEQQLEYLQWHDSLTKLPNRHMFYAQVEQALALAKRKQLGLALLCLDLDNFKDVNDSFGVVIGDEILVQMAQRLRSRIRSSDCVARLGGDEFIVLFAGIENQDVIVLMAEQLLKLMEQPFKLENGQKVQLSTSIGIATFPEHGDNAMELLQKVDSALYLSKQRGRDQFAYYSEEMTANAVARIELSNCLRQALAHDELQVYYQPQVDLHSGAIVGAEALMRWNCRKLGMVPPDRFIPLAEDLGCIITMGEWILRSVCMQGKAWLDAGRTPITLAVNLSVVQFYQTDIVKTVAQVLAETGYPAQYLELEVTESLLMHKEQDTITRLQQLHQLGISLAMDDFGTGYSSLAYLKYFPLQVLKIDKSFVDDLPHSDADGKMVNAIIQLGQGLGLKLLAEGVETMEQLEYLKNHGCNSYQGFYCSKPLPAAEFDALMQET
ncbi:MAG: EAL domain-containing protein [Desulfuromonas sp.]|nr:EAL domain-containing protein [Desulfuromonas sp.]